MVEFFFSIFGIVRGFFILRISDLDFLIVVTFVFLCYFYRYDFVFFLLKGPLDKKWCLCLNWSFSMPSSYLNGQFYCYFTFIVHCAILFFLLNDFNFQLKQIASAKKYSCSDQFWLKSTILAMILQAKEFVYTARLIQI